MALTKKKSLRKPLKKTLTKTEKEPPLPKVVGVKIKTSTGAKMLHHEKRPDHPAYHLLNAKYVFPETYYMIDPKTMRPFSMATLVPPIYGGDPLVVAWDSCGTCHYFWTKCKCRGGITTPRSVEYIYDKNVAIKNGDEESWGIWHPDYYGSLTKKDREARQAAQESRRFSGRKVVRPEVLSGDTKSPEAPSKRLIRKKGTKPLKRSGKPSERPLRPTKGAETVMSTKGIDQEALNKATTASNEDLVKQLRGGKKLLKKKR